MSFDGGDRKGIDKIVDINLDRDVKLNVKEYLSLFSIIRFFSYIWDQCLIDRSVHCSSSNSLFHCSIVLINVTLPYFLVVSIEIIDSSSFPIHRCHCASPYYAFHSIGKIVQLGPLSTTLLHNTRVTRPSSSSVDKSKSRTFRLVMSLYTYPQSCPVRSYSSRDQRLSSKIDSLSPFPLTHDATTNSRKSGSTHLQYVSPRVILVRPAECG